LPRADGAPLIRAGAIGLVTLRPMGLPLPAQGKAKRANQKDRGWWARRTELGLAQLRRSKLIEIGSR
jgi:hypothetical protein